MVTKLNSCIETITIRYNCVGIASIVQVYQNRNQIVRCVLQWQFGSIDNLKIRF